jgi:hypothetical protein
MSEYILSEDLAVWFGKKKKPKGSKQPKGPWVNICRKDKDGKHPPCGRDNADKGAYPKCRAAGVAGKMSAAEKKSACAQKRRAEKKDTQTGKGQKPVMTSHKKKKKNESIEKLTSMVMESLGQEKQIKPSSKVIKSICDAKEFCSAQGPITFGQLKSIVNTAKNKRLGIHVGEGGIKAFIRLLPWFIPQIAVAGMFSSAMRAANKLLGPTLKETSSYKSWWAKAIMKMFSIAEGDINTTDPFSKIFFISDGLMNLMNEENKLKFAFHIAEVADSMPDDQAVPEFFVENELRNWVNQRFVLDPPLEPKQLSTFDDVEIPTKDNEDMKLTESIKSVLSSYIKVKQTISEDMKYHMDYNIPISENVFRPGSEKYFNIINEARKLKELGLYNNQEDNELLESDLGKYFKYNGLKLPLDFPLVKEDADKEMVDGIIDILNQVKDVKNREDIANNMMKQFDVENVEYDPNQFMSAIGLLSEAEYQGKKVELGKPKSGGSKKWYVYVRNPKTGKIKKVSYGSPVMTAKWNDPDARASFAARHQCDKKKDKTKAGYWACRAHKDFGKNVPGRFW